MPNVWCHLLLADQFLKELPDDVKKDIKTGPNRPVFRLGCLGPDFFLFHGWNRLYYNSRHEISSYIHRYHCVDALLYSIKRIKEEKKSGRPWWTGAIYALGAVSHFIVDATIHPLVYSIVPKSKPYQDMHVKLEVEMDVYLAKGLGLPEDLIISNPSANLTIPRHGVYEICRYYYEVVNHVFHDELKPLSRGKVLEALEDYMEIFEVLRARGALYHMAGVLGTVTLKKIRFDWFWHPPQVSKQVEGLLDEGRFWDLCDDAIAIGNKVLPLIWGYWCDELPEAEALALIKESLPSRTYLGVDLS